MYGYRGLSTYGIIGEYNQHSCYSQDNDSNKGLAESSERDLSIGFIKIVYELAGKFHYSSPQRSFDTQIPKGS